MSTRKNNLADKYAGALFGFAIGDAMGATTEFMTAEQIRSKFGRVENIIGGGWLGLSPGEVTDDTQMTLCIIDALQESDGNLYKFQNACAENFVQWANSGPKDIGGQCAKGIAYIKRGAATPVDENAQGNGSLMRALPCALVGNLDMNIAQSRMTHNSAACDYIIRSYHDAVQSFLNDDYIVEGLDYKHMEPTGWAVASYNNARYFVSTSQTLSEAILGAVNDGGDADTIAAITGSLAGLRWGYRAIPKQWLEQLDKNVCEKLQKFLKKLLQSV